MSCSSLQPCMPRAGGSHRSPKPTVRQGGSQPANPCLMAPWGQILQRRSLFWGAMAHFSVSRDFCCSGLGRLKNQLLGCCGFLCLRRGLANH